MSESKGLPPSSGLSHELRAPEIVASPAQPVKSPNYGLWLVYLYLRPRKFFAQFIHDHLPPLTALCAWMMGFASAYERVEARMLTGKLPPQFNSWGFALGVAAAAGVLGAVMYFYIGGWWYRLRLRWSGAKDPDARLARRVYLYASTVCTLPAVVAVGVNVATYPTPIASASGGGTTWDFVVLLALLWSVVTSYIGVRVVFGVKGLLPALWFLILPILLGGAAVIIAGIAYAMAMANMPANVSTPQRFERGAITFKYPANWVVDTQDPDHHPDWDVTIHPPQDAIVMLKVFEEGHEPEEIAQHYLDGQRATFPSQDLGGFEQWGVHSGIGHTLKVDVKGEPGIGRIFAGRLVDGRCLCVTELWLDTDRSNVSPGFRLIENSTIIGPASSAPPVSTEPEENTEEIPVETAKPEP